MLQICIIGIEITTLFMYSEYILERLLEEERESGEFSKIAEKISDYIMMDKKHFNDYIEELLEIFFGEK